MGKGDGVHLSYVIDKELAFATGRHVLGGLASVIPVFCFRESDLASLTIWMHGKALRRILAFMKSCVTCRSVTLCSGFRPT